MTPPRVIAHRGASLHLPDNSLQAYEAAIAAGADLIELDVRTAADGSLVCVHDAAVGGTRVGELSPGQLGERLGHGPVLLGEALELAAGRVALDVELKEPGAEPALALLRRHAPAGLVVTSFHDALVARARVALPRARCGLLLGTDRPVPPVRTRLSELWPARRARACGAPIVALHHRLAELGAVGRAAAAGLEVLVWTVDDDAGLRRWLGDPRVGGVITDDPARARSILDQGLAPGDAAR